MERVYVNVVSGGTQSDLSNKEAGEILSRIKYEAKSNDHLVNKYNLRTY